MPKRYAWNGYTGGKAKRKSPDIIARVGFLLYRYIYNALGSLEGPRA